MNFEHLTIVILMWGIWLVVSYFWLKGYGYMKYGRSKTWWRATRLVKPREAKRIHRVNMFLWWLGLAIITGLVTIWLVKQG